MYFPSLDQRGIFNSGVAMNQPCGNLVEVFGDFATEDQIAARGRDELRPSLRVAAKRISSSH